MKPTVTSYSCSCGKACRAPIDHVLALLAICEDCQAKRYAAGLKAQRTTPPVAVKATTGETH